MKFLQSLLKKTDYQKDELETQISAVIDPRIRELEYQMKQLKQEKGSLPEEWATSYKKLQEENRELAKRPTIMEFHKKTKEIQQLMQSLKNLQNESTSPEEYDQLKQESVQLKKALFIMKKKAEELQSTASDQLKRNEGLTNNFEQLEKEYFLLKDTHRLLEEKNQVLKNQYEEMVQKNELLFLQVKELSEQIQHKDQLLAEEEQLKGKEKVALEKVKLHQLLESDFFNEQETLTEVDWLIEKEEIDDDMLLEQEVDEQQVEKSMSEQLLKTIPESEQEAVSRTYTFLDRSDEAEEFYLQKVIKQIHSSMRPIRKVDFSGGYERDYASGYADGIMRKKNQEHNSRLEQVKKRPYIGRFDYISDEGEETLYIGDQGIEDSVVSWKSEAASLYYLKTAGQPMEHKTLGNVTVDYIRQIDIQNSRIETLHPPITATSRYFKDEGLVAALSSKRGNDMQSIVATLQKEQYEMIRLPMNKPLIIQGSAGSGKSAIALHRLSYLLYKHQKLKSNKVAILGPNEAFIKHIRKVLPELGDFGVKQTHFLQLACDILSLSPSKVKRRQEKELVVMKVKGSLEFQEIVHETTMNMFNDHRVWAKPYVAGPFQISIVPILREMERYPELTLKERENLYYNFFFESFTQEIKRENDLQKQFEEWVEKRAEEVELEQIIEGELVDSSILQLGEEWESLTRLYRENRSEKTKEQAESIRKECSQKIKKVVQSIMHQHRNQLQQSISTHIDEKFTLDIWRHIAQKEVRREKDDIILNFISEQPDVVLNVEEVVEDPEVQQRILEVQEQVIQRLELGQQTFFEEQHIKLGSALMQESLMRIERRYFSRVTSELKNKFDLQLSFVHEYTGYAKEDLQQLSSLENNKLKKYVKTRLEINRGDCFSQAVLRAKNADLLPESYESSEIFYEDLPALLHINRLMSGIKKEDRLSYLIVDEAQDYMPYEIVEINALTERNRFMLIGDLGQNLNKASSLEDWQTVGTLIGDPAFYQLLGTYRSTSQIVNISNQIIEPFAEGKYSLSTQTFREGSDVQWIEVTASTEEQELMAVIEEAVHGRNYESIAVIVKEETRLPHYLNMINPYFTAAVQTTDQFPDNIQVVITTPRAAKGLEFEAVVVVEFQTYESNHFDRKLAYVSASRALHQLYVIYEKGGSCLLSPPDMNALK